METSQQKNLLELYDLCVEEFSKKESIHKNSNSSDLKPESKIQTEKSAENEFEDSSDSDNLGNPNQYSPEKPANEKKAESPTEDSKGKITGNHFQ